MAGHQEGSQVLGLGPVQIHNKNNVKPWKILRSRLASLHPYDAWRRKGRWEQWKGGRGWDLVPDSVWCLSPESPKSYFFACNTMWFWVAMLLSKPCFQKRFGPCDSQSWLHIKTIQGVWETQISSFTWSYRVHQNGTFQKPPTWSHSWEGPTKRGLWSFVYSKCESDVVCMRIHMHTHTYTHSVGQGIQLSSTVLASHAWDSGFNLK